MSNIYSQVDTNKRRSLIIMILFVVFITGVVWVMSQAMGFGPGFVGMALIFSGFMSLGSYYFSDRIVLAMSGAREATRERDFDFYTATENLVMAARIPMPRLYVIEDNSMNAFATGRDPKHGVVVATRGLLNRLDRTELEGVIAHELAHIKNYDIRLMAIVTILIGVVTLLSDWFLRMSLWGGMGQNNNRQSGNAGIFFLVAGLLLAVLSPIIASMIRMAISRRREFLADATAAKLTRYPEGLARALEKLSSDKQPLASANKATAHMYIVNPLANLKGSGAMFANLFSTHPPIEERVKALRGLK